MVSFLDILDRQLMVLCLIAVGVLVAKIGLVNDAMKGKLSDLVVKVIMPCNIVSVLMVKETTPGLVGSFLLAVGISFAIQFVWFFVSGPLFFFVKDKRRPVLRYGTLAPNSGFIGIPVIGSFYGAEGLVYLAGYLLAFNCTTWSVGLSYFKKFTGKEMLKQVVTQPVIIGSIIGAVLIITGLRPPIFIEDTIHAIGNCITPVSLIVTGSVLAGIKPKSLLSGTSVYYAALRLIGIPLITLVVLMLLGVPAIITTVLTMAVAMPTATSTVMAATLYDGDAEFASGMLFLTTIISMVTLPLMAVLIGQILPA